MVVLAAADNRQGHNTRKNYVDRVTDNIEGIPDTAQLYSPMPDMHLHNPLKSRCYNNYSRQQLWQLLVEDHGAVVDNRQRGQWVVDRRWVVKRLYQLWVQEVKARRLSVQDHVDDMTFLSVIY